MSEKIKKRQVEECSRCEGFHNRTFVHMCPESSNVVEIEGCPHCDDECPLCIPDIGGEG